MPDVTECPQHGPFRPWIARHGEECDTCDSLRKLWAVQQDALQRRAELMTGSGIPQRFREARLEAADTLPADRRKALQAAERFVDEIRPRQGGGLVFIGPPGTGKTWLACATAMAVIQRHALAVRFTTARAFLSAMRGTWRRGSDCTEADVVEDLTDGDLLVLDDIGAEAADESARAMLLQLVDDAYSRARALIITSNFTRDRLLSTLGERMFDRLVDGARVVALNGESRRKLANDD